MSTAEPQNANTPQPTPNTQPPQTQPPQGDNNHNNNNPITITLLTDPSTIYPSALSAWTSLFGSKTTTPHPDQPTFATTYSAPNGRLLLASTPHAPIAGIIAYRKYDNRFSSKFPSLHFSSNTTANVVEVVRLFVDPELRGKGIATRLIRALVQQARADGVGIMYLHTHPFLPGAQYLWEKEGWRVVVREEEGPWWTIHMRRELE